MPSPVYVEVFIRAGIDELWRRTQRPDLHQRWDLRFSEIEYLPRTGAEPQRFRYGFRPMPGVLITGVGVATGERRRPDGSRTSALRFSSEDPRSLIRHGHGYWRYIPVDGGVRFLTGYGYRPGWGTAPDRLFRPIMGWATAWSFDRLRLWLETGRTPERLMRQAVTELLARLVVMSAVFALPLALAAAVVIITVLLPPLPGTPAARRCLRRPTGDRASQAPDILTHLEQP